jgi:hypothetical protein
MKFLFKSSKRKQKILLAGLALAQTFADVALYSLASDLPTTYHMEASFDTTKGFKVVVDKR